MRLIKNKKKIQIEILGGNSEAVTGSCSEITFLGRTILFECGMIQEGNTPKENFILNSKMLEKIKPQKVEMVFLGHVHADHSANIPALYRTGKCKADIIVPLGSYGLLEEMWFDSAYINERDAEYITKKTGKLTLPTYTKEDAIMALEYVREFPSHEIITLDENIKFRFIPAGHILCSQQTELFITIDNHVKKIVFTSDLGNLSIQENKVFVEKFEPISKANIVIGECTYSARKRGSGTLEKDLEKIKCVIQQYCIDSKNRVIIPCFALDRTPYMLWILYSLYGEDETFKIPVIVDSPLAIRDLDRYAQIVGGEMKDKFDKMMAWNNIQLIITPEDSRSAIADSKPKIVLSSSGMLTAGRSVKWVSSCLPRENDCILFIGYCATNTLAHKIKFYSSKKTISINGKELPNRCQIVDLHSFSSHMQRDQLINYYKSFNCEKIYLVHGDNQDKLEFKNDLIEAIANCSKTTGVVAVNRSTKITL